MRRLLDRNLPFFFSVPVALWYILFLCIPLALVFYTSISSDISFFTLAHYYSLLSFAHAHIIFRSLLFATLTTIACIFLAFPIAYFIALRVEQKYRSWLLFLLTVPFWTSFLVQAYAWFFLLDRFGLINSILRFFGIISAPLPLSNSLLAIFCVMVYCYLPFMILPIYTVLQKIDKRLLEASYDLGATYWQTMRNIIFPLSLSGIKVGSLLVFVPSFGEFIIPILMGGAKYLFVGPLISHYILVSHNTHVGAAFMFLSGFVLLLFLGIVNRLIKYLIT